MADQLRPLTRKAPAGKRVQTALGEFKLCPRCETLLPIESFGTNRKGYPLSYCRSCWAKVGRENRRKARAKNPGKFKEYYFRADLRRLYGITPETYAQMMADQSGLCAICSVRMDGTSKRKTAAVDHDHETGRIRALLCCHCNMALGTLHHPDGCFCIHCNYLRNH